MILYCHISYYLRLQPRTERPLRSCGDRIVIIITTTTTIILLIIITTIIITTIIIIDNTNESLKHVINS